MIQVLSGHSKLDTTARYAHVATNVIREVVSPLDQLTSPDGQAADVTRGAMARPALEVADIFRDHGAAWRNANAAM